MKTLKLGLTFALAFSALPSSAEDFKPVDPAAETRKDLTDPSRRAAAIQAQGKKAEAADALASRAAGGNPEAKEQLYGISANIMDELVQRAGGDEKKLQEIIQRAQADPEGFYKSLSAGTRGQVSGFAAGREPAEIGKNTPH